MIKSLYKIKYPLTQDEKIVISDMDKYFKGKDRDDFQRIKQIRDILIDLNQNCIKKTLIEIIRERLLLRECLLRLERIIDNGRQRTRKTRTT